MNAVENLSLGNSCKTVLICVTEFNPMEEGDFLKRNEIVCSLALGLCTRQLRLGKVDMISNVSRK